MEYLIKKCAYGPDISAIPPLDYKVRFDVFIEGLFSYNTRKNCHK